MTTRKNRPAAGEPKITIDDIKHRAEAVTDMAVSDVKHAVTTVAQTEASKKVMIAVGVVIAVATVAYLMGSAAARRRVDDLC